MQKCINLIKKTVQGLDITRGSDPDVQAFFQLGHVGVHDTSAIHHYRQIMDFYSPLLRNKLI